MKWVLIGASTMAEEWMIDAIRSQGGDIVGVYSGNADHGQQFCERNGIPTCVTVLERLLPLQPDAVYISSTNEKHRSQVEWAAENGLHVYCEKPLALTLDSASAMVDGCRRHGVAMATNHHLRHAALHRAIREHIDNGSLGEVLSIRVMHAVYLPQKLQSWRINDKAAGGGVILDIAVHNADLVAYLLGEYPRSVQTRAASRQLGVGVEDDAMSIWAMPSGATVYTHESFVTPFAGTTLEVHGTKGSLTARNCLTQKPMGELILSNENGSQEVSINHHNLYYAAVSDFCKAVAEGTQPACDGMAGVKSLAVALAMLQADESRNEVEVFYGRQPSI